MDAHPVATTATDSRGPRPRKGAPALDPGLLMFLHDETFIGAGHLVVTATYPSRSAPGVRHRVTVRDDGAAVGCSCTGATTHGRCYHQAAAPAIATEYRRRECAALSDADLRRQDAWYAQLPADGLDAAQRIIVDALCEAVAERYIATHGRVAERQEVRP